MSAWHFIARSADRTNVSREDYISLEASVCADTSNSGLVFHRASSQTISRPRRKRDAHTATTLRENRRPPLAGTHRPNTAAARWWRS
jgi:hypothetical protein